MEGTKNGHRRPTEGEVFNPKEFVDELRSAPQQFTSSRNKGDRGFRGYWDDQIVWTFAFYLGLCIGLLGVERLVGVLPLRFFMLFGLPSGFFAYRVFRCKSLEWRVSDWLALLAIAYMNCGYLAWAFLYIAGRR